jgi:hypothetical protein
MTPRRFARPAKAAFCFISSDEDGSGACVLPNCIIRNKLSQYRNEHSQSQICTFLIRSVQTCVQGDNNPICHPQWTLSEVKAPIGDPSEPKDSACLFLYFGINVCSLKIHKMRAFQTPALMSWIKRFCIPAWSPAPHCDVLSEAEVSK